MRELLPASWEDENPYYLVIHPDFGAPVIIDLGKQGWIAANAGLMRAPGMWYLLRKIDNVAMFGLIVLPGEQPYYTARHVGTGLGSTQGPTEIIAYGIGKKRLDGHVERMWILPNGLIVPGDDVDPLGVQLARANAML